MNFATGRFEFISSYHCKSCYGNANQIKRIIGLILSNERENLSWLDLAHA